LSEKFKKENTGDSIYGTPTSAQFCPVHYGSKEIKNVFQIFGFLKFSEIIDFFNWVVFFDQK